MSRARPASTSPRRTMRRANASGRLSQPSIANRIPDDPNSMRSFTASSTRPSIHSRSRLPASARLLKVLRSWGLKVLDLVRQKAQKRLSPTTIDAAGCHPSQPIGSCATQHPQQQRFGLIARVMGGRDPITACQSGHLLQGLAPQIARGFLERRPLATRCANPLRFGIDPSGVEIHSGRRRRLARMSFVCVRLSPSQTVMDVPDHACEFEFGHAARNQIQQHHRIPAPGHGQ